MNEISYLERNVLDRILRSLGVDSETVAHILRSVMISERSFSADVSNKEKCVGFFLEFVDNELLASIADVPHHLGIQATHKDLPTGGDFILYFDKAKAGLKVLEGSFFGNTLQIDDLLSKNHGFLFRDNEKK